MLAFYRAYPVATWPQLFLIHGKEGKGGVKDGSTLIVSIWLDAEAITQDLK